MPDEPRSLKPIFWIASAREDMKTLPDKVQDSFGYALYLVQTGKTPPDSKPLSGFSGAGVLEIVEDYNTDTYRAVYTVRFRESVYVLHVFQKKSKRGIGTPVRDMDLIRNRLKRAEEHYRRWIEGRKGEKDGKG